MKDNDLKILGDDIIYYDGHLPEVIYSLGARKRFLDVLWLPCSLAELTPDQIGVISRFRESRLRLDGQFEHARFARNILGMLLQRLGISRVIEIGCGKFPLASDTNIQSYRAIEIDSVAIDHCRKLGFEAGMLSEFINDDGLRFEAAIALYTFHFAISNDLIAVIDRFLKPGGFLLFNLIVDETMNAFCSLASLSRYFEFCQVIKTPNLASREVFFVMGRLDNCGSVVSATAALRELLLNDPSTISPQPIPLG